MRSLATLLLLLPLSLYAELRSDPDLALIGEAAGRLDDTLQHVAQSTVAIGAEYLSAYENVTVSSGVLWDNKAFPADKFTEYRFLPFARFNPVRPSAFAYGDPPLSVPQISRQLDAMQSIVHIFRAAYHSFDFSWVYLTTSDNVMFIYPTLSADEAGNNYLPTDQVFYTVAQDLETGQTGWTAPYLDLVGAGIMVTVSTPVRKNDQLLAVASRDITLQQLTASVLWPLAKNTNGRNVVLVDSTGLAIDAATPELADAIQRVNNAHKAAALYFLPSDQITDIEGAVASEFPEANAAVAAVLAAPPTDAPIKVHTGLNQANSGINQIHSDFNQVYAARVPSTDWYLIMTFPSLR